MYNSSVVRVDFLVEQDLDTESSTELTGVVEYVLSESGNIVSETIEEVSQLLLIYSLDEQGQRIGEPREYVVCTEVDELTDVARIAIHDEAFKQFLRMGIVRLASVSEEERI